MTKFFKMLNQTFTEKNNIYGAVMYRIQYFYFHIYIMKWMILSVASLADSGAHVSKMSTKFQNLTIYFLFFMVSLTALLLQADRPEQTTHSVQQNLIWLAKLSHIYLLRLHILGQANGIL